MKIKSNSFKYWTCIVLFCFCVLKGNTSSINMDAPSHIAWWKFDDIRDGSVLDQEAGISDAISGNYKMVKGISGEALKLDGFTTQVTRNAEKAPELGGLFSMEAWIAAATYPWNWTPIVAQEREEKAGYYFGIGPRGNIGFFASIDGKWQKCVSENRIALKEWTHVAATYNMDHGFRIYINGSLSGQLDIIGTIDPAHDMDLLIGMNREKVAPSHPVRTYATLPGWFSFDGIFDEIRIYNEVLSGKEIAKNYSDGKPAFSPDFADRVMPSGPTGPGRFGAYYTQLKYYDEWDALWRVGDHSDIVVQFDESPIRVVFWRGTRYSPVWVMENGQWMADQSAEYFDTINGCFEHMIDPRCMYSHVRIIENTKSRVVVHWRYIPVSVRKQLSQLDEKSGWSDCIDEYYTFYPDGIGVRKVIQHTTGDPLGPSEAIVLCQPGTTPEDNVYQDAMTLVNLKAESHVYSWADGPPVFKKGENPTDPVIQIVNLKSENKPFLIFEPENRMEVFGIEHRKDVSSFPWWNHWPVAQLPSDGRYCQAADRASHFSLAWGRPPFHKGNRNTYWSSWIYGASTRTNEELAMLGRSWIDPPELVVNKGKFISKGYDLTQRAYLIEKTETGTDPELEFQLLASEESPVVNACIIIQGCNSDDISLNIGRQSLQEGKDYSTGLIHSLEGDKLLIWLNYKSTNVLTIQIE